MGNNYIKQLGIKPEGKIGTREFNAIWDKYAEKDKTMKRKNAVKFLKDFSVLANVNSTEEIIEKLLTDAGVQRTDRILTKESFISLFFANAENTGYNALTRSVMAIRKPIQSNSHIVREAASQGSLFRPPPPVSTTLHTQSTPNTATTSNIPLQEFPSEIVSDLSDLFEHYTFNDPNSNEVMEMQGLIEFLKDLEITPDDVVLLVIGFHLKANIIGVFTKEQFVNGFAKLNLSCIDEIKGNIPQFRQFAQDEKNLKEIYRYAHQFYREKPIHKTIPLDTSIHVLGTLLPSTYQLLQPFRDFLIQQTEYKALNLDQWMNIFDFLTTTLSDTEMNDYSEISSWPYIIDLFVDWWKEKKEKKEGEGEGEDEGKKKEDEGDDHDVLMKGKFYKM